MKDPYAVVIDCLTLYDGFAQSAFDHNRLKISVSSTAYCGSTIVTFQIKCRSAHQENW